MVMSDNDAGVLMLMHMSKSKIKDISACFTQ